MSFLYFHHPALESILFLERIQASLTRTETDTDSTASRHDKLTADVGSAAAEMYSAAVKVLKLRRLGPLETLLKLGVYCTKVVEPPVDHAVTVFFAASLRTTSRTGKQNSASRFKYA